MPGMYLGYPFDPELFLLQWQSEKDPTLTAMFESGAVQQNATIKNLISNGSDYYTIPIYDILGGTPDNYDGKTDITMTTPAGHSQSGIVFGRAHSWKDQDFIRDYDSGADPGKQISSQVSKFWQKQRQKWMLGILGGAFETTDDTYGYLNEWKLHTTNIATTTSTITDENRVGATTTGDAIQKAVGDNSGIFSMAWMHSRIANRLAGIQLLQFRKYTDMSGIERQLAIADYNGMMIVVDDGVPVKNSEAATNEKEYTTYLMGAGALQYATAPVDYPVSTDRDELKEGGFNFMVTRMRETIHPNGFSYKKPTTGYTASPTDAQLFDSANWLLPSMPKNIPMARIISNG